MSQKTIPELTAITVIDQNAIFPVDSGIQTYKITSLNLMKNLYKILFVIKSVQTTGFTVAATDVLSVFPFTSAAGAFNIQLPDPATVSGFYITFKDVGGLLSSSAVTLLRFGTEKIEGLAASYVLESDFGNWKLYSDGTDWWII